MITLVTKQDLWWHQRERVRDHYMKGEYATCIDQVQSAKRSDFRHEYLSASLVICNMITQKGETLASCTAGYDQNIQFSNLRKLLDTVQGFAKYRGFAP
jgi:hypothetical protein